MQVDRGSSYFLCVPYEIYYEYAFEIKDELSPDTWDIIQKNMDKCRYIVEFGDFISSMAEYRKKFNVKA